MSTSERMEIEGMLRRIRNAEGQVSFHADRVVVEAMMLGIAWRHRERLDEHGSALAALDACYRAMQDRANERMREWHQAMEQLEKAES